MTLDGHKIAVDVFLDEVIKKATTLTNECFKSAGCCMIFVI